MSKLMKLLGAMACSPLLWGAALAAAFCSAAGSEPWSETLIARYFAGHWTTSLLVGVFAMGMAALVSRLAGLATEHRLLQVALLDAIPPGGQPLASCETLLDRLDARSAGEQQTCLLRRLRDGLEYVYRGNSADDLDAELRYLAQKDLARLGANRTTLQAFVVVVPCVGLATVGAAVADAMTVQGSFPLAMATAFDLLSVAGVLTALLVGGLQLVKRLESNLLAAVDTRVAAELIGRFEPSIQRIVEPNVAIVRGMAQEVIQKSEQLVTRQSELWKSSFEEAQQQWSNWSAGSSRQLQETLSSALSASMQEHAASLAVSARTHAEQTLAQWQGVQQALLQNAEAVTLQQRELVKQSEVLTQVIAATGQIEKLESELNRNLSTLAGAKNFEQTVLSLGAAIQLLNSKLGAVPTPETPKVELKAKRGTKAA